MQGLDQIRIGPTIHYSILLLKNVFGENLKLVHLGYFTPKLGGLGYFFNWTFFLFEFLVD